MFYSYFIQTIVHIRLFTGIHYFYLQVDITAIGVEVTGLGKTFPGNITELDNLMIDNGYKFLGNAGIDKFYVKNKAKKKRKTKEEL